MKKLRIVLALILAATISISALSLLVPKPADADVRAYYSPIATSVVLVDVLLASGSAILFLMALKNFKPELKPAYRLMAFSALAVGVGLLIFPYIEYYGLWDNLALNMASYAQYFVGAPLMYFGVRMFYKKVGLGGWGASLITVIVGIVVCSAIHPFLPYDNSWPLKVWQYDLFKVVAIIPFVLYGIAAFLAFRLRQRTGDEYKAAFNWLTVGLGFYVVNTLGIILIEIIGYNNPYYADRIYTAPAILGDLGLLLAGYCFAAIGLPKTVVKRGGAASSMDIIIYAAGMASDQTKIDSYLDDMRVVTSNLKPGEAPSGADQTKLRDVYLKIEDFLLTGDQLRTFNKDDLRKNIVKRFRLAEQADTTFWTTL